MAWTYGKGRSDNEWKPAAAINRLPYHRQNSTSHGLCYTSCGAFDETRNSPTRLYRYNANIQYLIHKSIPMHGHSEY